MWVIKVFSAISFTVLCATSDPLNENTTKPTLSKHPDFNSMYVGETVTFICEVNMSSGWNYQWYIDGNEFTSAPSKTISIHLSLSNRGKYSCKASRDETSTSSSEEIQQDVYEIPVPSLRKMTKWLDVFPTESVKLSCGMEGSSDWSYTWYKDEQKVQADNTVSFDSNGATLSISSASAKHRGQYKCKGHIQGRSVNSNFSSELTLTVYDEKPSAELKQDPDYKLMFIGESVSFKCHITVPSEWEYLWFKDGDPLGVSGNNYSINHVETTYNGLYSCKAKRGMDQVFFTSLSQVIILKVEEIPVPSLRKMTKWLDVFPTESVKLSCGMEGSSDWSYTWYKDEQKVQADNTVSFDSSGATLSISSASVKHRGQYKCKGHIQGRSVNSNFSSELTLTVYDEKPSAELKQDPDYKLMFIGESVSFKCHITVPSEWEYLWFKDGDPLGVSGNNYSINHVEITYNGLYSCKAKRGMDQVFFTSLSQAIILKVEEIPVPSLRKMTKWLDVFPTESVKLSCGMEGSSDWSYTWYKAEQKVQADNTVSFDSNGATLSISSASAKHRGQYKCKGHIHGRSVNSNFSSELTLTVYENTPKPTLSKHPDFNSMYVGETVTFICEVNMSSGWKYQWYIDRNEFTSAPSKTISIHLSLSNRGKYSCKANRDETLSSSSEEIQQDVYEIPVPSLRKMTKWLDVFPTESVKLSCGMEGSSDWSYTWYKDEQKVQADNTVSFDSNGATLSISSASAKHRGQYKCKGHIQGRSVNSNFSSELTLTVYETKPRVTLSQNPEYNVLHTEDSVSFRCQINVSSGWEYLWFKDGTPLTETGNCHNISSAVMKNTGLYTCQVKRGTRTVFQSDQSEAVRLNIQQRPQANIILLTGWSEVFATESLLLRCEVQDSQDMWNYTWFIEGQKINLPPSERHTVTPQNDPDQSLYTCHGIRSGRPSYSKRSDSFKTKNLLLKRRVLLSISGCLFFGLIVVFLGCIVLRLIRKPADDEDKPEEENLFLTMAQLKDRTDAPNPLVEYITDAALNTSPKEGDENGMICSETTPLPITTQEELDVMDKSPDREENNVGLAFFKQ